MITFKILYALIFRKQNYFKNLTFRKVFGYQKIKSTLKNLFYQNLKLKNSFTNNIF